jgi:hypothetical protein
MGEIRKREQAAHRGAGTLKSYTPPHVQAASFTVVNTGWRLAFLGLAWPLGVAVQLQEQDLRAQGVYGLIALVGVLAVDPSSPLSGGAILGDQNRRSGSNHWPQFVSLSLRDIRKD